MRDWFQMGLLSLCESLLWGLVTLFLSLSLDLFVPWSHAFAVIFVAHLLGQSISLATIKRVDVGGSCDRFSNTREHAKNRMLFVWAGALVVMGVAIWVVFRRGGYRVSWLYIQTALCVLASASGINSITKHLDAAKATRKMVFGTIVFFVISLFSIVPQAMILRHTVYYLVVSSVFIVRQRGSEVDQDMGISRDKRWNLSSVVVVCTAGFVALVLVAFLSGGKRLLSDLYQLVQPFLEKGFDLILLPVAYLLEWISNILSRLIDPNNADFAVEFQPFLDQMREMQEQNETVSILPIWVKWLFIGLVTAAVLVFLWRFISRTMERPQGEAIIESRVSVASSDAVKEWLDLTLSEAKRKLAKRFEGFRKMISSSEPQTIQDLYLATVEYASKKIVPKDPSQTPLEYLDLLRSNADSSYVAELVGTISLTFSECYYSGTQPTSSQWRSALSAYRMLTQG